MAWILAGILGTTLGIVLPLEAGWDMGAAIFTVPAGVILVGFVFAVVGDWLGASWMD